MNSMAAIMCSHLPQDVSCADENKLISNAPVLNSLAINTVTQEYTWAEAE
jgi:hypothetical protein